MDPDGASNSTFPPQLPPALQLRILSFQPPNDRALSGRQVSPDAAAALSKDPTCTASLSQPLPLYAVAWATEAGHQHARQLSFRHKLQMLCTAAASGSEVNLEVAWELLQPSVFPEMLQRRNQFASTCVFSDPGVAAVEAGHPHLLPWLLHHCPGLIDPHVVLAAAAQHCDLKGLQTAWEPLQKFGRIITSSSSPTGHTCTLDQRVLNAAAASPTPDAIAKLEWMASAGGGSCRLQASTAEAAARSGDLRRIQWLRDRGCPVGGIEVLRRALQHADLVVAQWLVDEAGCGLPMATMESRQAWKQLLAAAASSSDGVAKLQWLQERGAPVLGSDSYAASLLVQQAARAGQLDVVRYVMAACSSPGAALHLDFRTVRDMSVCVPVAEHLRQAGVQFTSDAYLGASQRGDLAMVRWLALEAGVPTGRVLREAFIDTWPNTAGGRDLREAVEVVVGRARAAVSKWRAGYTLGAAARRGDLALFQYLLPLYPWYEPDEEVLVLAAKGGCEALLEWLTMEHSGCLSASGVLSCAYIEAAKNGDRGTLTALRRLGVPWGVEDALARAVRAGCQVPVLRWLAEQGAPAGSARGMSRAVGQALAKMPWMYTAEAAAWMRGLVPEA